MAKSRSKKIRESARGEACTMRIIGCMPDRETVVLAHLSGAGIGLKSLDIHGAYLCLNCHDIYDGRKPVPEGINISEEMFFAVVETQKIMHEKGLIK